MAKIAIYMLIICIMRYSSSFYTYDHVLDGKACGLGKLAFDDIVTGKLSCAGLCKANANCKSWFYNVETGRCQGCTNMYFSVGSLPTENGTKYYRSVHIPTLGLACTTADDCNEQGAECIVGKCYCSALAIFDNHTMDCLTVCSGFSNTFTKHNGTAITGLNDLVDHVLGGVTECQAMCTDIPRCGSFEIYTGRCNVASLTLKMLTDANPSVLEMNRTEVDLYDRNCVDL